jgi:hypothetical protein
MRSGPPSRSAGLCCQGSRLEISRCIHRSDRSGPNGEGSGTKLSRRGPGLRDREAARPGRGQAGSPAWVVVTESPSTDLLIGWG